jgi:hypothetical protein
MPVLLTLSLLALVLTKIADIVTTVRGVRRCGGSVEWERNPLARWAFRRFGLARGIGFIMGLWAVIAALAFAPAFFAPGWYQAVTAAGGFLIAWTQWDVARMNATGRHSRFTRWMLAIYERRAP